MLPKISIITVVRNNRAGLEKTLDNLTAIDYPELELVVIDGASTDGTQDIMARFADRIAYRVSEPDKGLYDAMNKGMIAATGDYIWFINAGDTVFAGDTLSRIFTEGSERSDIYYGETVVTGGDGKILGLRKKPLPDKLTARSLKKGMVVCHQSFIVKSSIAPFFDLRWRYVSDIDWVINCLTRAASVKHTGMILSCFETGGISTRHRKEGLVERWKVMKKYFGLCTTLLAHMGFVIDALRPDYRRYDPSRNATL